MNNYKKDFPIFQNNKNLVFLDSGASSQKPQMVIKGISDFLSNNYANIHRGSYELSKESEYLFDKSKKMVAKLITANSHKEIIYTYNATYAFNMLVSILGNNNILKKEDKVLLGISEHHANLVSRQILQKQIGFKIEYINLNENLELDINDFTKKYTDDVKVVSVQHISNVTGSINNIEEIGKIIKKHQKKSFFIIDASQSIPHLKINVQNIGCDFLIFTGHKIMANTGIGVLRGKEEILKKLNPVWGGGDMIKTVNKEGFTIASLPTKFEPGTPNIVGAISLLKALEYIENIGGIEKIREHEQELINYFLKKFNKLKEKSKSNIKLIGKNNNNGRIGVFSFILENMNPKAVGNIMAENNICIRAGGHCAHPLMHELNLKNGTFRISLYIYNDKEDIDKFFEVLKEVISLGNIDDEDDDLC